MATEQRRLARGLSSMLSPTYQQPAERMSELAHLTTDAVHTPAQIVPVKAIRANPYQPRREMDDQAFAVLVESIRRTGILQPVLVRQQDSGFELVAGHRRWQAAQQAGLASIPAVVRQASDEEMLELALIENIHREDLNSMDRALAYRQYRDRFGLSAEQIGERVGEDRSTVSNYLRLLSLPDTVQKMVAENRLGMGQARALLGLPDPLEQIRLAARVVEQDISVRQVEALVRKQRQQGEKTLSDGPRPLIQSLQEAFGQAVGLRVRIKEGRKKNTGRVVIEYKSLEDFDKIAEQFGVSLDEG